MDTAQREQFAERARAAEEGGDLLPLLWSTSSPRIDTLRFLPAWTLVEDRLLVTFVHLVPGRDGRQGLSHWTRHRHREMGSPPFADLLDAAYDNLTRGLAGQGYRTDDGDIHAIRREGGLAAAAVVLPDFLDNMSPELGSDRLVVGLPCPDELYLARADSPMAEKVHELVQSSEYPDTELVPCVLSLDPSGIELIAERH